MSRVLSALAGWKGYALMAAVMLAAGFASGWTVRDWKAGREDANRAEAQIVYRDRIIEREREQADVTSAVETKAAEAQVQIRTVTQTIIKEVPVYVPAEADAACVVPRGAVVLLNAAAAGEPLPESAGEPDAAAANAAPSGIALSRLVGVTAENYGSYQSVARQLVDLQDWIRQQQAVTNAP